MSESLDRQHHALLAQVASFYYEENRTQNEIGECLGISRVKVYRLLQEARERGVVRIDIHWPQHDSPDLAQALCQAFHLREALVLDAPVGSSDPQLLKELGKRCARYLESILPEQTTMAICLGRATYEVVQAINPDAQRRVKIAQAIGNIPRLYKEYDSSALVTQLAQKLGGDISYLASPLMADTPEAAQILREQREIHWALETARSAEFALIGIGNLAESSAFVRAGYMTAEQLEVMRQDGAAGDLAWQIITHTGTPYPSGLNDRIIGITLEELRRIPTTIAIASGVEKAQAILAALRTGVIDVLCTESRVARLLLSEPVG
jgi:DNA-binding transcriptional regulator LsrR (DeoR family)